MPASPPGQTVHERIGRAIEYLESRLGEEFSLHEAARRSGYSRTHFVRLFRAVVGFPAAEYVRRRRLSCAAEELAAGRPVLETALDWGYGSHPAFTRVFSRSFGVSPAAYARGVRAGNPPMNVLVAYYPRRSSPGLPAVAPLRVEKPALQVAGLLWRETLRGFRVIESVPSLWADWYASARWKPVGASPWTPTYGMSRVHASGDLDYMIAVEVGPGRVPHGYRRVSLPARPYAVFSARGAPAVVMPALWLAAYGEWRTKSYGSRRIGDWDLEFHRPDPQLPPGVLDCELWIPLRP